MPGSRPVAQLVVWARGPNVAVRVPLATVGGPLANTQKKVEKECSESRRRGCIC